MVDCGELKMHTINPKEITKLAKTKSYNSTSTKKIK